MSISLTVHRDGSFDVEYSGIKMAGCYPGIDNTPLRPVSTKLSTNNDKHTISYQLRNGLVELCVYINDGNLQVESRLAGLHEPPLWFHPIFEAKVSGIEGIYNQGFGISGLSGYSSLNELENTDSHGLMLFLNENSNVLCAYCKEHKRFVNKYDVMTHSGISMTASFRLEHTVTNASLPMLYMFGSSELPAALAQAANEISKAAGNEYKKQPLYSWCSWYYMYHNFSHELLCEYLKGFAAMGDKIPLQYIQIDAGYFTSAGDWLTTNHLWPHGMKAAADEIISRGFKPGIWIAPYMVSARSRIFNEHKDWLLHKHDGSLVTEWRMYYEGKVWGYPDEEYHVLDTSHPDALEYIRNVFRQFKSWGYDLFKTDFMLWGHHNSADVKRYNPGKTSVEYFIELQDAIKEEIGDSFWLGCIAPFYPMIGYVDAMRIAGDVGCEWDKDGRSQKHLLREITGDTYFNFIYWQNDPDAMIIRDMHTHLSQSEWEAISLMQAISAGAVYTSDPIHLICEESQKLFQFMRPVKPVNPSFPFIKSQTKETLFVNDLGGGEYILFFFNSSDDPVKTYYDLHTIIGSDAYLRNWKTGEYTSEKTSTLFLDIGGRDCALFFASQEMLSQEINNLWVWK